MERCQKVDEVGTGVSNHIIAIDIALAKHNLDDISESFKTAVERELRKKRDDALREVARGTHREAFDALNQFASEIREKAERCQKVDEVVDGVEIKKGVRDHINTIDRILAEHKLNDISEYFKTAVKQELLRQKGDKALREAIEGEHREASDDLNQFASEIREKAERCQKVDRVEAGVIQDIWSITRVLAEYNLNDISEYFKTAVEQELRQKGDDALREGIQGAHGQAFDTLNQFASEVNNLANRCTYANLDITLLEAKSLNKALNVAVKQEFRQTLGDALRESIMDPRIRTGKGPEIRYTNA